MERVLAVLPEEHRDNVVYLDQHGNVHVNRPELKQQVQFARPLGGGRYAWPDGSEFSLPEGNFGPAAGPTPVPTPPSGWVPPPCNLETSGSFRRVLSWPGSGPWWGLYRYAAFSANVWLPDASLGQVRMASQDTGYIYTGGWGESPDSTVDAGIQYSQRYGDWAPFIALHGGRRPDDVVWNPGRLRAGQYALLQFYVPADGYVALRVQGEWIDGSWGSQVGRTMVTSWRADGLLNRLKRVTSIAQLRRNYRSGSYLLGVHWFRTALGRSLDTLRPWDGFDTAEECNVPPDRVTVQRDSPGDEYVSIDLR